MEPRGARTGMTILEVVLAAALLVATLLAVFTSLTHSVRSSRAAEELQLARQTAAEVVERMRAVPRSMVADVFWIDSTVTTATLGGQSWVVADAHAPTGVDTLTQVRTSVLAEPMARGVIAPPPDDEPVLALRLLSEAEYGAVIGASLDLDLDGATGGSLPPPGGGVVPSPGYVYYPVLVRVAWRGDDGVRRHTLVSVVGADLELDRGP